MKMILAAACLCSPLLLGGCIVDDHGPGVRDHEHYEHERDREEHHEFDHDHEGPR